MTLSPGFSLECTVLEAVVCLPGVVNRSKRTQASNANRPEVVQSAEASEPSTHDRIAKQHL
jgi:hypothetical protein